MFVNLPQSPDIGRNSHKSISDFQIPDQFFINENCHNSRNNDEIDTQPTFTCSKLTKETLEQGVKYVLS